MGFRGLLLFEQDKHKQDGYGGRLPIVGKGEGRCTEYHIAVIAGDVRVSMQQVIQNIIAVRMKVLKCMGKRWEALG